MFSPFGFVFLGHHSRRPNAAQYRSESATHSVYLCGHSRGQKFSCSARFVSECYFFYSQVTIPNISIQIINLDPFQVRFIRLWLRWAVASLQLCLVLHLCRQLWARGLQVLRHHRVLPPQLLDSLPQLLPRHKDRSRVKLNSLWHSSCSLHRVHRFPLHFLSSL